METLSIQSYSLGQLDDSVVVRRVVAGERELFEILMRRYNQRLYRIVRSYLRDEDDVQDAMQNTYLKAFDKLGQFQGASSFSTWLIRIGINESLLRLKEMKKGKVVELYGAGQKAMQIPDKQMNAEHKIIRQEMKELVEKAIDNLPEKYRIVYMLSEVEGLPAEEVCSTLDVTHNNFKVRLHRAKAMLKENLFDLAGDANIFEFGNRRCDRVVHSVMSLVLSGERPNRL